MRPAADGTESTHVEHAQQLARCTGAFIVQANWPNSLTYPEEIAEAGHSVVLNPSGDELIRLPMAAAGVGVFDLGQTKLEWHAQTEPVASERTGVRARSHHRPLAVTARRRQNGRAREPASIVSAMPDRLPSHTLQRMKSRRSPGREIRKMNAGAQALGAFASGALAAGGFALGAIAVGAIAVGAVAVGRLAVGRARIRRLEIDELLVRRLLITEELRTLHMAGEPSPPQAPEPALPLKPSSQSASD